MRDSNSEFVAELELMTQELEDSDPEVRRAADDDRARLMVAREIQKMLVDHEGGTDLSIIQGSRLPELSGISPRIIFAYAHADRNVALLATDVFRLFAAAGYRIDIEAIAVLH